MSAPRTPQPILLLLLLSLASAPLQAEPRLWHSPDGSRSFSGEYVSHDHGQVTIRRADGRVFTLELSKLHADDRAWLAQRKSPATAQGFHLTSAEGAVFDNLKFGDTHAEVMAKLRASQALELTVPEVHLARMGLDGSFRTRQLIDGLHFLLFFDWDDASRLTELSLQTDPQPEAAYAGKLQSIWTGLAELLSARYGKPANTPAPYPDASQLTGDRMVLGSHLWKTPSGSSILLGTAREAGRYSVLVRFSAAAPGS